MKKIAIIGCGNMARVHIPYILKIKDVQLIAVCDKNEIRAKELAQHYDIHHYTQMDQMLENTNPDVVHILTPPQSHTEIAIQCLDSGCNVFVEKPLCLTLEEVDAIYTAAQSNDRIVGIDHNNLWSPLVQKALQVVQSGQIGRLINIQYVMGDDYLEVLKEGYGRWALDLRGGVFADLIPHPLYLNRAFIPELKVHSVKAIGSDIKKLRELWVDFISNDVHLNLW
ncbi:MAG: dehydrogenase, partial [Candidatus Scalindua rubra]